MTTTNKRLAPLAIVPGIVAALALAVTFAAPSTPAVFAGEDDACPANPSPPDADDPSIIVETPASGATVTSPVTVSGQAHTFEANVQIRILGEDGTELANTFTTAAEAAPALSPFSTTVAFTVAATQPGCVVVFEESAEDGSPLNVVQVPVTLQAAEATPAPSTPAPATATPAVPVAPPATGTGGAPSQSGSALGWTLVAAAGALLLAAPAFALSRRGK